MDERINNTENISMSSSINGENNMIETNNNGSNMDEKAEGRISVNEAGFTSPVDNTNQYNFYSAPKGEVDYKPYQMQQLDVNNKKAKKQKKAPKQKKPVTMKNIFAMCMVFFVITVATNVGILYSAYKFGKLGVASDDNSNESIHIETTIPVTNSENISAGGTSETVAGTTLSVSEIGKTVMPSIVAITNTAIVQQDYNPFYGGGSYQVQGAGSGIIIGKSDTELLIITNNHVIEDSTSLTVEFCDGKSTDEAYVKSANSSNDLAIVGIPLKAIKEDTIKEIRIAAMGSSDSLVVGDQVVAIGNALGYGQSLTVGYVSAVNREINVDNNKLVVIQTDAAINGGNSGGALINMKGEVIGINVAKSSGSGSSTSVEGMGYAIPVSNAEKIISNLLDQANKTKYSEEDRGYLGASTISVDSETSAQYGLPKGAYIRSIVSDSPADKAGMVAGSVITEINGVRISTADELIDELSYFTVGDEVTLKVTVPQGREYEEKEYKIKLGARDLFD